MSKILEFIVRMLSIPNVKNLSKKEKEGGGCHMGRQAAGLGHLYVHQLEVVGRVVRMGVELCMCDSGG